jgi:hypothetical protein
MEITNISQLDSNQFINQDYKTNDESLLNSLNISEEFGLPEDKVEVHVVSPNGEILNSVYDFRNYTTRQTIQGTSLYNQIELDPKADLESFGINQGQYGITYYFYRPLFLSSEANRFYISEISSDRTEIKISTNNISYTDLGQSYLTFIAGRNSRAYYSDFILNFGDNETYIGVNVAFDNSNEAYANLYIKLYEPLPSNIKLKDTFWIVENISEPYAFQVNTEFIAEATPDTTPLRGPNINIGLVEKANLTTPYLNLSSLLNSSVSSSYQQLQSWLEEKSIEITVDYTDFSNFVHFSSAKERLENFKYKLTQIQSLQSDIDAINNLSVSSSITYTSASVLNLQNQLNTLIEKFDGYEYFLYYESGSNSWPKSNSTKPYINSAVTTSAALTWFGSTDYTSQYYGGQILEADNYDINNKDYIWNNLPEYIKADSQNSNLELFTSMLGQHYDYIWTYIKDITDLQIADNRIDYGISKDLVADTLRNFGIKLYTNSRNQEDLYLSLLGVNADNSTLPSTGSYMIDTYVTASQYTIPDNDIVKETYKRLYHNLPYLLKAKGTRRGLRALINCFGITDTILKIKEYGGNRKDLEIIEQITPKFNYSALVDSSSPSNYISIVGAPSYKQYLDSGSNDIYPDTLEFRFKLDSNNILPTQSILESAGLNQVIRVTYISESYANIDFGLSDSGNPFYSTPITLPLYNNDWWNLNLTRETGSIARNNISYSNTPQTYTLTIGNKDSNGIQYLESCSMYRDGLINSNFIYSWLDDPLYPGGNNNLYPFTGSIQEFRYWIGSIPIENFKDHILNPQSIAFNGVSGSYNNLIFRAPLGSELDINNTNPTSVHPSTTASFWNGVAFSDYNVYSSYSINYEDYLVNTPNIGSFTEIDEKIRVATPNLVPGDVLTPYISIQKPEIYPYTNDLNIVEVAISPQDSINEDIISQLGSFNIDEYIGDPRLASSGSYPALTDLRNFYFKKYSNKENIFDLIKLLSYFDNSLFKMIKDFVPAKANLSTGLVINTNILERNKIARHEPVLSFVDYSGSIETAFITGSNGLDQIYNTSYTSSTTYTSGSISIINNDNRELFTGELGGTIITAHSQSLDNIIYELNYIPISTSQDINQNFYRLPLNPTLNNISTARTSTKYLDVDYSYTPIIPVNFNYLTSSLFSNLDTTAFSFLNAPVQDSNYTLKRHTQPRYEGSTLYSKKYNIYSTNDISFGKDPVININPIKFAFFNEISSQSLTFNGRSNANIKYLIDSSSNIIELTEANNNLFDVQNIFNKTNINISLDNTKNPSNQKSLNGLKSIYAGGFRYEPILQNYSTIQTTQTSLLFNLENPIEINNTATGSQVTASVDRLTVNNFSLATPPYTNIPLNISNPLLSAVLNSGINVTVIRNVSSNETVYQKVSGQITVTVSVSPPSGQTFQLWGRGGEGPFTFSLPFPLTITQTLTQTNGTVVNLWDYVRYITLPAGYTATTYNGGGNVFNTIGPRTFYQIPSYTVNNGIDYIEVKSTGTAANLNLVNQLNSFGANPTFTTGSGGPYNIEDNNGLSITATFQIQGIVALPPDRGSVGSTVTLPLKTLEGVDGVIRTIWNFTKTSTSSDLTFTTAPSNLISISSLSNGQYIFTDAPSKIYINNLIDNGYSSGSGDISNWYFERGKNNFNNFTQLTASYNLSNFYKDYISSPVGSKNYFTQVLPTASIDVGYQDITELFIPKVGDLIKFYNHENETYPFSNTFEREIINIIPPQGPIGSGSFGTGSYENRLVFEVFGEDIPNIACINKNQLPGQVGKILNFILLSKIPDETNIIINHEKNPGLTSAGILFTEDIIPELKNEAGNIIKGLKSQNLI